MINLAAKNACRYIFRLLYVKLLSYDLQSLVEKERLSSNQRKVKGSTRICC